MKVSHKQAGLGIVALAIGLMGSAAIADNSGMMDGPMGGHMGMMGPAFDFAAADANKDGKVTADEFNAWRAAQVAGIDTDKDGKISADELAAMHLKAMEARAKDMADHMIKALDTDGDGKLSAAELLAAPMPPNAFAMADTNKDGSIDQAEADAMAQHGPMDGPRGMKGPGGMDEMGGKGGMGGHHGKHHWGDMGQMGNMGDMDGDGN